MYNGGVIDKDDYECIVPKIRLEKILNCFNTNSSTGDIRIIRK